MNQGQVYGKVMRYLIIIVIMQLRLQQNDLGEELKRFPIGVQR